MNKITTGVLKGNQPNIQNDKQKNQNENILSRIFHAVAHKIEKGINSLAIMFKPKMERLLIEEDKLLGKINKISSQLNVKEKKVLNERRAELEHRLDGINNRLEKYENDKSKPHYLVSVKKYLTGQIDAIKIEMKQINDVELTLNPKLQSTEQRLLEVQTQISNMRKAEKGVYTLGTKLRAIESRLDQVVNDLIRVYENHKPIPTGSAIKELRAMKAELELAKKEINNEIRKHPEWKNIITAKLHVINDKIEKADLIIEHKKTEFESKDIDVKTEELQDKLAKQKEEIDRKLIPTQQKYIEINDKVSEAKEAIVLSKDFVHYFNEYNRDKPQNAPVLNEKAPVIKDVTDAFGNWIEDPESTKNIDDLKAKIDKLIYEGNIEVYSENAKCIPEYHGVISKIVELGNFAKLVLNTLKVTVREKNDLLPSKELEELNTSYETARKLAGIIDDVEIAANNLIKEKKYGAAYVSRHKYLQDELIKLANDKTLEVIFNKYPKIQDGLNKVFKQLEDHKAPPRPSKPAPHKIAPPRPSTPAPYVLSVDSDYDSYSDEGPIAVSSAQALAPSIPAGKPVTQKSQDLSTRVIRV